LILLWVACAWVYASQSTGRPHAFAVTRPDDVNLAEEIHYGTCEISVPFEAIHTVGKLERPQSFFGIQIEREDPSRHVTVLGQVPLEWEPFIEQLRGAINSRENTERECFVFIHGFRNTFEDAAKRTAQFTHDLGFQGAPILYSWPSHGAATDYSVDEGEATFSRPHFTSFLRALLAESTANKIHLIAHSMGTQILAQALVELGQHGELDGSTCTIRQIVLAAPDIDERVFKRDLAPHFGNKKPRVTLYASANDEALAASRGALVHNYRRAGGAAGGRPIVVQGIETVDASPLDTSLDTHSYFAACRTVVDDIREVMAGQPPARRGLRERKVEDGNRYWMFPP
jgi:esterase/lipase superfamily enzyme